AVPQNSTLSKRDATVSPLSLTAHESDAIISESLASRVFRPERSVEKMTNEMSDHNTSRNSNLHEEDSTSSRLPDLSHIQAYYDETWLDYRMLWLNPQNRAIHFGYWDEHTRSHTQSLVAMNRVLAS